MNYVVGNLVEPIFRPPSEWDALLIGVTNGCTHRCTFCSMYRTKKFSVRKDIAEIKDDILKAREMYEDNIRKIFFEDGNAFVVKSDVLIELTQYAREIHPNLKKVSAYAHAKDILKKSDDDLKRLADTGFTMVYVGIESGDDQVLKDCKKAVTQDEFALAAQKCHRAGIDWSGIFLLGLTGNDLEKSHQHAVESAKLINDEEIKQIWLDYKADPTRKELRNKLVERYLSLVRYNGERIWARLPEGVSAESSGCQPGS